MCWLLEIVLGVPMRGSKVIVGPGAQERDLLVEIKEFFLDFSIGKGMKEYKMSRILVITIMAEIIEHCIVSSTHLS